MPTPEEFVKEKFKKDIVLFSYRDKEGYLYTTSVDVLYELMTEYAKITSEGEKEKDVEFLKRAVRKINEGHVNTDKEYWK